MAYNHIIKHIPIIGNMTAELHTLFERILNLNVEEMKRLFSKERDLRYEMDLIDKMISNHEYGGNSGVPSDPELSVMVSDSILGNLYSLENNFEWDRQNDEIKYNNVDDYYRIMKNNFQIYDNKRSRLYKECINIRFCGIFNFLRALYYRLVNTDDDKKIYNYLNEKLNEIEGI